MLGSEILKYLRESHLLLLPIYHPLANCLEKRPVKGWMLLVFPPWAHNHIADEEQKP